jgi:DeoR/GlpR family transcriptional regulator of sugar metabolism
MQGAARVAHLADLLDVSDMTVRRDLDTLHEAGALVKVHGGAMVPTDQSDEEPGFDAKSHRNTSEKSAIATRAATFALPGGTIGITAGTTTWRLAAELATVPDLTVVTNSLRVIEVFNIHPRADRQLVLSGGVRTPSDAMVGPIAVAALGTLHVDTLFIGVHGMSARAGFTTPNMAEAATNHAFINTAAQNVVLADHTKWNVVGLSSFAALGDVDALVTDRGIDDEALDALRQYIGDVAVVDVDIDVDIDDTHDLRASPSTTTPVRSA